MNPGDQWSRPPDAPGFAEAARAGLLPQTPAQPPTPLPGRSAARRLHAVAVIGAVAIGVWLLVMLMLQGMRQPSPTGLKIGWLLIGLAGFGWLLLVELRKVGNRMLAELNRGYTTLTISYGSFWQIRPHPAGPNHRVPWDYSAIWVLTPGGDVRRAPQPDSTLPPGLYPSVERPGEWELWTGAAWGRVWRDAPHRE